MYEHVKNMGIFFSVKPFLRTIGGFDWTTNSFLASIWLHWLNNENISTLAHINIRYKIVNVCVENPDEIDSIAMSESLVNIKNH